MEGPIDGLVVEKTLTDSRRIEGWMDRRTAKTTTFHIGISIS